MSNRWLTALPVFNERDYVDGVLDEVAKYAQDILVIDDGSTDGTADILSKRKDISTLTHAKNRGYGAALHSAFTYAVENQFDYIVTIDCDGQHEPQRIPRFFKANESADVDIVSGSRYLKQYPGDSEPPAQRRWINQLITGELNECLGLDLTDAFCGFKSYRVESLKRLELTEEGYAMPLELWVQAARVGINVIELPVPLIYLDADRSFGGTLDDGTKRLTYYRSVIKAAMKKAGMECKSRPVFDPECANR
ncbi:MAG: glycosyltransferase involved in cell wall biosynthesis [Pirellulaceae bacterium]|jgi:glycosyltransferase involved in cell wall biosynthesis